MMKEQIISVTYGELIDAFNEWNKKLEAEIIPERPAGNDIGEMFTNYLISVINKARADRLTSYAK